MLVDGVNVIKLDGQKQVDRTRRLPRQVGINNDATSTARLTSPVASNSVWRLRARANDPPLLLVIEPTANLD
ncbi:MAG: hypothetical protein ACJ789_03040 [Thermomicrobiales bacterium]